MNKLETRSDQWLGLVRRFNAAEGAFSPTFNRRRARMLRLGGGLMFLVAVPWAIYFANAGQNASALLELIFMLAGLGVVYLVPRKLLRIGSLLFALSGLALIVCLAVGVDVPTPAAPRS